MDLVPQWSSGRRTAISPADKLYTQLHSTVEGSGIAQRAHIQVLGRACCIHGAPVAYWRAQAAITRNILESTSAGSRQRHDWQWRSERKLALGFRGSRTGLWEGREECVHGGRSTGIQVMIPLDTSLKHVGSRPCVWQRSERPPVHVSLMPIHIHSRGLPIVCSISYMLCRLSKPTKPDEHACPVGRSVRRKERHRETRPREAKTTTAAFKQHFPSIESHYTASFACSITLKRSLTILA